MLLSLQSNHEIQANSDNTFHWTVCESRDQQSCQCSSDAMIDVIARCQFTRLADLNAIIKAPTDVIRLYVRIYLLIENCLIACVFKPEQEYYN
jgi:hypothetical protein